MGTVSGRPLLQLEMLAGFPRFAVGYAWSELLPDPVDKVLASYGNALGPFWLSCTNPLMKGLVYPLPVGSSKLLIASKARAIH